MTASVKDRTWEMPEREEPKVEMLLAACILYLPQFIKIFYINMISSLDCELPEDRAYVIFTY